MDLTILLVIILSILPISEIRGGIPLGIIYANSNDISIIFIFLLAVLSNILAIFIAFYFLDNIHKLLMKNNFYQKSFNYYVKRLQNKVKKFEKQYSSIGFLALTLFVGIPLPATGAWSGALISYILGLNRKKSIISIGIGVVIAGILITLGTKGILTFFS